MRFLPLFLSAAFLAFAPVLAHAASPAPATPTASTPAASAPAAAAPATPAGGFTDAQKAEIGDVIKDYLVNKHPEVLMEAIQELQKRQTADSDAKSKEALKTDHDKLYSDPQTPVGGNPKGPVTVVEFFDYACGYCKMSEPHVEKLLKDDKNVKFVYKDYPILGAPSTEAARAALAAAKQGKYVEMHDKLMNSAVPHGGDNPQAADDTIFKAAKAIGLDVDKLKKDMKDAAIDKQIQDNVSLGMDVGARAERRPSSSVTMCFRAPWNTIS